MSPFPEQVLAQFAATLAYEAIPPAVVRRCEELMLDWFGSALAGKGVRPVEIIEKFAGAMGPASGPSEVIVSRRTTSPLFAAMVNAAASHVAEQDDVHNGSVFHPAAVVFPPALAVAQAIGASGRELLAASVAGYEVGIRIGEYLGQAHYKVFHTTGTAGSLAAAAAAGRLLGLSPGPDARRLRLGRDAGRGLVGISARRGGFEAPSHRSRGLDRAGLRLSGEGGLHRREANPDRSIKPWRPAWLKTPTRLGSSTGLGERWALAETSFKFHASCRHTHPAADALLQVMREGR